MNKNLITRSYGDDQYTEDEFIKYFPGIDFNKLTLYLEINEKKPNIEQIVASICLLSEESIKGIYGKLGIFLSFLPYDEFKIGQVAVFCATPEFIGEIIGINKPTQSITFDGFVIKDEGLKYLRHPTTEELRKFENQDEKILYL